MLYPFQRHHTIHEKKPSSQIGMRFDFVNQGLDHDPLIRPKAVGCPQSSSSYPRHVSGDRDEKLEVC